MPKSALLFPVCCVVLIGSACSRTNVIAPTPSAADDRSPREVVVLGDSLAVSPSPGDNFPAELQERLDDRFRQWRIVNASANGSVSADGVARVERALTGNTRILVLELGANDGLRGIPTETIEQNLAAIIKRAQSRGVLVLICGMETLPTHGWDYTVRFHNLFPRLAARYNASLVPFLLAGVVLNSDMNGPDGVHPNAAGAERIAENVWPYLEPLVTRETAGSSAR